MLKLVHPFMMRCKDRHALLGKDDVGPNRKVYKFNAFAGRLEKEAKKYGGKNDEKINEYKGWGFELFGEALIKSQGQTKRIGISNYQLVEEDDDTGVDGYGIGSDGKTATVQLKYRQANYVLTANNDHLTNFTSTSLWKSGVIEASNMLIITSGKGLHWHTKKDMLPPGVRCINREKIRVLVDDCKPFWDEFRLAWTKALKAK